MNTIDAMFRENVERFSNRIAIRYYQEEVWEQITYSEMDKAVTTTAAGLLAIGTQKGAKIAIMSENRPEWMICYFAIATTGGVAIPLDAHLGEDEAAHILNHSEAEVLFCSTICYETISRIISDLTALKHLVIYDRDITVRSEHHGSGDGEEIVRNGKKNNHHKEFLSYDNLRGKGTSQLKKYPGGALPIAGKSLTDLVSIIYTSGTTGTPKGVMLTHKNFMSNVFSMTKVLDLSSEDNFLLLLPLHHVFPFTSCLLLPLKVGAAISFVDILSRNRQRLISECHPTIMLGVPLLYSKIYRGIIRQIEASKIKSLIFNYGGRKIIGKALKKKLGGQIRVMISGAAPMEPSVIEGFTGLGIKFLEGYGLTETSPLLSVNLLHKIKIGSVGPACDGVEIKIVDPDSEGVGEIAGRGDNIMVGYHKNPEATAQAIRDGWFHTGDLGYMDDEGYLFITGRAKDVIVNRGGKNVFPELVEFQINKGPFIEESIVLGYKTEGKVGEDVGVLIYPDYEALIEHAMKEGVQFEENIDIEELTEDAKNELIAKFRQILENEVKAAVPRLAPHQRPTRIAIERDEFVKTSTRKIKRFLYKGRLDILDIDH